MGLLPNSLLAKAKEKFVSRGKFFRDMVTLLTGTLISRVVAVIAIPFLARIYTPVEFGMLALFMTVNELVTSVACARYEMAVVLPDKDSDSFHLLLASVVIATLVSILSFGLFVVVGENLAEALGKPELARWLWLNPVAIWALSMFNILRSWASRKGQFGGISRATVGNTFVTALTQFLLGFPQKVLAGGLILGQVFGQLFQAAMLLASSMAGLRSIAAEGVSFARARELLYRYRRFAIYDTGANLLNSTSRELPVLLLGVFFSPAIIGFYAVSRRILATPVQLVSIATAQVFFPKARDEMAKGKLDILARTVFTKLAATGMAPIFMLTVVAQEIVKVFLGEEWVEAGIYFQWLTLWTLAVFIASPFSHLFSVLEKQRERLVYVSIMVVLQVASLSYGGSKNDPVLAIALFSCIAAVGVMANCMWLMSKADIPFSTSLGILGRQFVLALPFVVAAILAKWFIQSDLLVLVAICVLLLLFAAIRFKDILGREVSVAK